jgi:CMP-N-acetylneuraminic acid synthetase
LLKPQSISKAIDHYLQNKNQHDSLFSVTRLHTRLYDQQGKALNHNPAELLQTQDLPPIFEENSCIYIFTEQGMVKSGHRIGSSPIMFEIDDSEAWDIDTLFDLQIVNLLLTENSE